MIKEIVISTGRIVVIKELKYKDIVSLDKDDTSASAQKMMQLSTGLTDEEYADLSIKDGISIQKLVNEVNGLTDFQKPQSD